MNNLQIFENENFGKIRVVEHSNEPYFLATDICKALGLSNPSMAVSRLDEDERAKFNLGVHDSDGTNCVNEYGLYNLVLASKKKEAKEFKRWITHEVLPSIRKNGGYIAGQEEMTPEQIVANALIVAQNIISKKDEKIKALEQETLEMGKAITEMQPKVDYVDTILKCKSTVCTTQIAQDYGMSATAFNKTLRDLGVQHKVAGQWILYKQYLTHGYVQSETVNITRKDGTPDTVMNTKWTTKGRLFLYELLKKNEILPLIEMGCVS